MKLEVRRTGLQFPHAGDEAVGQLARADQAQQRSLGIGTRDDPARGDFRPILEFDADRGSVANQHALHWRVGTDFRPGSGGGIGQRSGDHPHPASHDPHILGAAETVTANVGVAERPARAERIADVLGLHERAPHRFVLEELGDHVGHAAGQQAVEKCGIIGPRDRLLQFVERGWRPQEERVDDPGGPFPELDPPRIRRPRQAATVGIQLQRVGVEWQHVEPVPPHLQLVDHLGLQQVADVRAGRHPETGEQLLGRGGPTDEAAAFEDQHVEAGAAEITGADQRVVPAADDHHIVVSHASATRCCHLLGWTGST